MYLFQIVLAAAVNVKKEGIYQLLFNYINFLLFNIRMGRSIKSIEINIKSKPLCNAFC